MPLQHYIKELRKSPISVIQNVFRYYLKPLFPTFILKNPETANRERQLARWIKAGCPVPPPHPVKQIAIREYQQKFQINTFIESGTFLGEMVEAQKKFFKTIISIELSRYLYEKARRRFMQDRNIRILHGDSGRVLHDLMKEVSGRALFWLDGHYSMGVTAKGATDCPIFEEINAILADQDNPGHILLIDDARLFTGSGDYPAIGELTTFILGKDSRYKLEVKDDIIRYWIE